MVEYFEKRNDWLKMSDEEFLKECNLDWFQASGPGGQKRNRKFSGVRLKHLPTELVTEVVYSRSQNENRHNAIKKLKLLIALSAKGPEIKNFRPEVSMSNIEYPFYVAKVFDSLRKNNYSVSDAAKNLNFTTSKLIKFLVRDEILWREINYKREKIGLTKLKG